MATKESHQLSDSKQAFLIYQDDNGITQVNVRFEGEDVWLPVELIMQLFDASQQDVSYHIGQIYEEGELDKNRTHKKFLLVRQEGNRSVNRWISHEEARQKALAEFEKYRKMEMLQYESDYDRGIKELIQKDNQSINN